jgi:hypothetical protein
MRNCVQEIISTEILHIETLWTELAILHARGEDHVVRCSAALRGAARRSVLILLHL